MRYYIIAGEASGDLHGSNLMKGIYSYAFSERKRAFFTEFRFLHTFSHTPK